MDVSLSSGSSSEISVLRVGLVSRAKLNSVFDDGFCLIIVRTLRLTFSFLLFDCLTCPLISARDCGVPVLSYQVYGILERIGSLEEGMFVPVMLQRFS